MEFDVLDLWRSIAVGLVLIGIGLYGVDCAILNIGSIDTTKVSMMERHEQELKIFDWLCKKCV